MKKKTLAKKFWKHKKFPRKQFRARKVDGHFYLIYNGPRHGVITDKFFSWQDAKAAGWRKCK